MRVGSRASSVCVGMYKCVPSYCSKAGTIVVTYCEISALLVSLKNRVQGKRGETEGQIEISRKAGHPPPLHFDMAYVGLLARKCLNPAGGPGALAEGR